MIKYNNIIESYTTDTILNPNKTEDRYLFIKKKFTYTKDKKRLQIPNNWTCLYQYKTCDDGHYSLTEWSVFNGNNK